MRGRRGVIVCTSNILESLLASLDSSKPIIAQTAPVKLRGPQHRIKRQGQDQRTDNKEEEVNRRRREMGLLIRLKVSKLFSTSKFLSPISGQDLSSSYTQSNKLNLKADSGLLSSHPVTGLLCGHTIFIWHVESFKTDHWTHISLVSDCVHNLTTSKCIFTWLSMMSLHDKAKAFYCLKNQAWALSRGGWELTLPLSHGTSPQAQVGILPP